MAEALAEPAAPAPAGQEPAAGTPAAEPTASAAEPTVASASEPTGQTGSEPTKPLGDKGVDELITQRRKRQQAEQEVAYWKGVASAGQHNAQPQQRPQVPQEPQADQFENWDDYLVAKATFKARQEMRQEMQQERVHSQIRNVETTWTEKLQRESAKDPDFQDTVNYVGGQVSPAMAAIIKASESGPEIVRHLANNPVEISRIASLDPIATGIEMGRLMAALSPQKSTTQRISQAPEPIKGLAATGSVGDTDLEKVPIDDFMSKRNAAQYKRRQ